MPGWFCLVLFCFVLFGLASKVIQTLLCHNAWTDICLVHVDPRDDEANGGHTSNRRDWPDEREATDLEVALLYVAVVCRQGRSSGRSPQHAVAVPFQCFPRPGGAPR